MQHNAGDPSTCMPSRSNKTIFLAAGSLGFLDGGLIIWSAGQTLNIRDKAWIVAEAHCALQNHQRERDHDVCRCQATATHIRSAVRCRGDLGFEEGQMSLDVAKLNLTRRLYAGIVVCYT